MSQKRISVHIEDLVGTPDEVVKILKETIARVKKNETGVHSFDDCEISVFNEDEDED